METSNKVDRGFMRLIEGLTSKILRNLPIERPKDIFEYLGIERLR